MSNGISESPSGSQPMPANGASEGAADAVTAPLPSETKLSNKTLSFLRRFFLLHEKIANAKEKCLGPSQPGWREFELAKDARSAIEEIRESSQNQYAQALLLRAELQALVRCLMLRNGLRVDENTFSISDWPTARKVPEIEALFQNQPATILAYLEGVVGECAEPYLLQLEPNQRTELLAPLRDIATALMDPLEREAETVSRFKIARYTRLSIAAVLAFGAMALTFGWFADHSGKKNLALNRPVTVTSQISTVGTDHRLLVDGDHTNLGFHTDNLPNQFVVIDLGSSVKFDKVVVYNRSDCCKERAVPLQLEVSDDNANYKKLAERTDEFDVWTASMLRAKGRYVRLRLLVSNPFHLAEVEVY